MKVHWLQKFSNERKDSIWYGGDIVAIDLGRYLITIGAYGDIRAIINGNYYCDKCNGGRFAEYLEENNIYNDNDLRNANIEWENNNWFEAFIWDNKNKRYIDCPGTIIFAEHWLKEIVG